MHRRVFAEFEKIIRERVGDNFRGRVLEVGAIPSPLSLLASPCLKLAERVGIDINGPFDYDGFTILQGNANHMTEFAGGSFELVLCNAMLEHDPQFWLTAGEMHRVLRPSGCLIVGVPGYTSMQRRRARLVRKVLSRAVRDQARLDWLGTATLTFRIHNAPGDYYRFSPQAMREVLLRGLNDVRVGAVMQPPRVIGSGLKPSSSAEQ